MTRTVVFILSADRSGSIWLSFVLGSHRPCAHLGEYYRFFTGMDYAMCMLCHARGKTGCEVLSGIEQIPAEQAYGFAFEHTGKDILIDSSKSMPWTARFVGRSDFIVKCVHLMRDPRGWYASERKRVPMTPKEGMARWLSINRAIAQELKEQHIDSTIVFYDELARDPHGFYPDLCRFIGMEFEPEALQYWNFDHHGPNGNGAAYNLIGKYEKKVLITGDDGFYQEKAFKTFHDQRWKTALTPAEITAIENHSQIIEFLNERGRSFKDLGKSADT